MTRERNDNHGTEFESWRRKQQVISSCNGYTATDVDFVWRNYRTGEFMFVEEKRYGANMTYAQKQTFQQIDKHMQMHPLYRGFHLLQFEKTTPDDGAIFWDHLEISTHKLIELLQFKNVNKLGCFYRSINNVI